MSDLEKNQSVSALIAEIVEEIGGFGKYQILIYILCLFVISHPATNSMSPVFLDYTVRHRCLVSECESASSKSYFQPFLPFTTPESSDNDWSNCKLFKANSSADSSAGCVSEAYDNKETSFCSNWLFDDSEMRLTTVSEYSLVCNRAYLQPLSFFLHTFGKILGSFILGFIADMYGRKITFLIMSLFSMIGALSSGLAVNYGMHLFGRIIIGISDGGLSTVTIIVAVELVPVKWRGFLGTFLWTGFSIGSLYVVLIAYFVRQWHYIQLIFVANITFIMLLWLVMSNNLMWLIEKGKLEEAQNLIRRICKFNKKNSKEECEKKTSKPLPSSGSMSDGDFESYETKFYKLKEELESIKVHDVSNNRWSIFIKSRTMQFRTFISMYTIFVSYLIFYGLSFSSPNYGNNIFVSYSVITLTEIPAILLAAFMMQGLGRKWTTFLAALVLTLCNGVAALIFEVNDIALLGVIAAAKFSATVLADSTVVHLTEIVPTYMRGLFTGIVNSTGFLGNLLVGFFAHRDIVNPRTLLAVFFFMTLLQSILIPFLPETTNKKLPQTIEEAIDLGRNEKYLDLQGCPCRNAKKIDPQRN